MNHRKLQILVSSYLDDEIGNTDKAKVLKHVEICSECQKFIEQAKIIRKEIKMLGEIELPNTFSSQVAQKVKQREERVEEWLGVEPLARNTFIALATVVFVMFIVSIFSNQSNTLSGDQFVSAFYGESASARVLLQPEDLSKNDVLYAVVTK